MAKWKKCSDCAGSGHIFEEPVAGFVFVKDCQTCRGTGRVPASEDPYADQLTYYQKLSGMTPVEMSGLWQEETADEYSEMMDVLPPIRMDGGAFMVGECVTHGLAGAIYDVHVHVGGRFFWRPAPLGSWDPLRYTSLNLLDNSYLANIFSKAFSETTYYSAQNEKTK